MTKADGTYLWSINQITDPSLSITTETAEAVDALGARIATFDRAKNAEFTAENSLFDLGLFAAQQGKEKEVASAEKMIEAPSMEIFDITADMQSITLKHTPITAPEEIFILKGDGTMGTRYVSGDAASDTAFVYSDGVITLPTGLTAGQQVFVMYDYMASEAVAVTVDAVAFPKAGRFVMEVLGTDVCDPSTLIHAYIVFLNAKLDANVDITFTTEGTHPFTLQCQQAYCDKEKVLLRIVIPNED